MKKDLVIGIVGTLILLTAMVGVFRYEAAQRGASFDVTWQTLDVDGPGLDGGTNEGESTTGSLNLTRANLTKVSFVLEWTDDQANTAPDEFNLTVTAPDGRTYSTSGATSPLTLTVEGLSPVPQDARLLGSDEAAARDQANRQFTSSAGMGAWNVTVTLVQAGDTTAPGGVAPPVPQLQDNANSWALRTELTAYEAALTPA